VTQSTSLDAELTVGELPRLYAGPYPRPRPIGEALELVGLTGEEHTRTGALSGGQQRRADLAVGIVGNPRLLFLDEPTTGFDPAARRQTWDVIEDLAAAGMTVLLTTHYLEEAAHLAARVVVIARGRLVADESPEQLASHLAGQRTARVRLPVPAGVALPSAWCATVEDGIATLATYDVTRAVGDLVGWSRSAGVLLAGLTVTQPTLEDAYLALTGSEPTHA
jgi:ABC-2 type transport system ATP-binding protein